jgi:cysteine-rich repeat protein
MFVDVDTYGVQCIPCGAMPGCIACDMDGCTDCDPIFGFFIDTVTMTCICHFGYYVSPMAICEQCRMLGCLDCDSATTCLLCENSTFYLDNETHVCLEICGDGVLYTLQCDDGNLLNDDGCNATCFIEEYFTCSGGSTISPSTCSYSGPVSLSMVSFTKDTTQNQVVIQALLFPTIPIFNTIDYSTSFVPNFPVSKSSVVYDPATGALTYTFDYNQPLNTDTNMAMTFQPPSSLQFFYTPNVSMPLPFITDNNLALKVYPS